MKRLWIPLVCLLLIFLFIMSGCASQQPTGGKIRSIDRHGQPME